MMMKVFLLVVALVFHASAQADDKVVLWTFDHDNSPATTHLLKLVNDPVMGGLSQSEYSISTNSKQQHSSSHLHWEGEVVGVPSLDNAPGFCNLQTKWRIAHFPDASGMKYLNIVYKSNLETSGFKLSFAANTLEPQFKSFKSDVMLPATTGGDGKWKVASIAISSFSNHWSAYTGEPIDVCGSEHPEVCATDKDLKRIQQFGLWHEGVAEKFDVEIKGIFASHEPHGEGKRDDVFDTSTTPTPTTTPTASNNHHCEVQKNLMFTGTSDFKASDVGIPVKTNDDKELLATAICCDSDFTGYAEPRDFFTTLKFFSPNHSLRGGREKKEDTTFYDSSCGIPLFHAPTDRSYAEWRAETIEHGWPSFRESEIIAENIYLVGDVVYSTCGTKLGSILNDEKGRRYCIDTVCIAGNNEESKIIQIN